MTGDLLILGAGGHAKVVADAALATGQWKSIAFADDRFPQLASLLGIPVVATCAEAVKVAPGFRAVVVAIGKASVRLQLLRDLGKAGASIATIVHPSAVVSAFAELGAGTVVFAQTAVNAGATLATGCIVNTGATIDHDCQLAEGVHVCPGTHLSGGVVVGARSWIGVGASVRQCIRIGADVTVGAGAAVVRDVADRLTVVGVPARPIVQGRRQT